MGARRWLASHFGPWFVRPWADRRVSLGADARGGRAPYPRPVSERSIWLRAKALARPGVADKLIAFGLMAFSLVVFFTVEANAHANRDPDALGVVLIVAATGALVYRRRRPVEVLVVASVAALTMHLVGYSDSGLPFAVDRKSVV